MDKNFVIKIEGIIIYNGESKDLPSKEQKI